MFNAEYIGKFAMVNRLKEPGKAHATFAVGKIVGADGFGLWLEKPDVKIVTTKTEYTAEIGHYVIRWDAIDDIMIFYKSDRSPAPEQDGRAIGFDRQAG